MFVVTVRAEFEDAASAQDLANKLAGLAGAEAVTLQEHVPATPELVIEPVAPVEEDGG